MRKSKTSTCTPCASSGVGKILPTSHVVVSMQWWVWLLHRWRWNVPTNNRRDSAFTILGKWWLGFEDKIQYYTIFWIPKLGIICKFNKTGEDDISPKSHWMRMQKNIQKHHNPYNTVDTVDTVSKSISIINIFSSRYFCETYVTWLSFWWWWHLACIICTQNVFLMN